MQAGGWGEGPLPEAVGPCGRTAEPARGHPSRGEVEPQAVGRADAYGATIGAPASGASSPGAGGSADARGGGDSWRTLGRTVARGGTGWLGDWASSGHQA
jgi:hypothetical protein